MRTGNIEVELMKARRELHLWRRIANQLHHAFTDPDATPHDRHDAIETYLNYHNPHDDD